MTPVKATTKQTKEKRGQGRPFVGENDVGKEHLISATQKLLREMPPARVTIARIAQEASVDPALVRYYFGNRTALLLAVVERITKNAQHSANLSVAPAQALAEHIRRTLRFTRSAPFMHRLMIEELADEGDDDSRARVRVMNLELVAFYRRVLETDAGETMKGVDPLFLHLMVLGTSDFFASAAPLIRELVPSNTDMDALATSFQDFLVKIVMDGLSKAELGYGEVRLLQLPELSIDALVAGDGIATKSDSV
jgi:TetR/AcrR family transcriptional regulator